MLFIISIIVWNLTAFNNSETRTTLSFTNVSARKDTNTSFTVLSPSVCKESASSAYTKFSISAFHNLSDFLLGPAELNAFANSNHSNDAVCRLQNRLTLHFPHVMQQIYPCISWWQAVSDRFGNSSPQHQPVLSMPQVVADAFQRGPNHFTRGILEYLQQIFHVTIRIEEDGAVNKNAVQPNPSFSSTSTKQAYTMQSPKHMQVFRDGVVQHLFPNRAANSCSATSPRIGILNRKETRGVLNIDQLVKRLEQEFSFQNISVAYFESYSFQQQIGFFSSVDLLISPHGAQLTGLPFMPTACAGILELLPKRYFVPTFYGSLAGASQVEYGYLYLSNGDPKEEMAITNHNMNLRYQVRSKNLCPPIDKIIESVRLMVAEWKNCCKRL
jgi:hypothetical protein